MDDDFIVEYVHGRHTVREYFDRFLDGQALVTAFAGCQELGRRAADHLWSALEELDLLPRTDPFWAGSNMRATFTKLRAFYAKRVPIEEADLEHGWRSFVIAVCAGDLDRFARASASLLRSGQLSLLDFLRTSLNLVGTSGWDTDQLTADLLRRLGLAATARPALEAIVESGSPHEQPWASEVLRRVGGAG